MEPWLLSLFSSGAGQGILQHTHLCKRIGYTVFDLWTESRATGSVREPRYTSMSAQQRGHMSSDRPSLRGLPRVASQPNLSASSDLRLSVIAEDGDVPLPPRAVIKTHNRPFSRRWNLGNPPRHNHEKSPPEYSLRDESSPKEQRFMAIRSNKQLAKRGGWKRLLCIVLFLIAVIIALAVGLSVGLKEHHSTRYAFNRVHQTKN